MMRKLTTLVLLVLASLGTVRAQSYHEQCWTGTDADKETPVCVKEIAKAAKAQAKREGKQAEKFAKNNGEASPKALAKVEAALPGEDKDRAALIANHQVFVGMTVAELRQSQRFPIIGTIFPRAVNTTVTADGVLQQEVYCAFGTTIVTMYVYITNGVVTSYQLMR